jgi:hypothetical protein
MNPTSYGVLGRTFLGAIFSAKNLKGSSKNFEDLRRNLAEPHIF